MPVQPVTASADTAADGFVDLFGRRFYRISDYDRLAPFFMTVVGASDVWLFVSSTGGLTAGPGGSPTRRCSRTTPTTRSARAPGAPAA